MDNHALTQSSFAVNTKSDLQQSDTKNILVFKSGTVLLKKPAGDTTALVTINHNLGYEPAFLAYFAQEGNSTFNYIPFETIISPDFRTEWRARVSKVTIQFQIVMQTLGVNVPTEYNTVFRYYLLREPAL